MGTGRAFASVYAQKLRRDKSLRGELSLWEFPSWIVSVSLQTGLGHLCEYDCWSEMYKYYVENNVEPGAQNYVHREGCEHISIPEGRLCLGKHADVFMAIAEAKRKYPESKGCASCCVESAFARHGRS